MPIHDDDLHRPRNRYLAVRRDATLRQAFALLLAPEVKGAPWWVLIVSTGPDRWVGRRFDVLVELARELPEFLDLPLERLEGSDGVPPRVLLRLRTVERAELGLGEAEDLARTSPEGVLVVCDHGRLVGVLSTSPMRSATGPSRAQLEELTEGVDAPVGLIEDRAESEAGPGVSDAGTFERRFTDVSCPRQVWLGTKRFNLVLRLTVERPELSRVKSSLIAEVDRQVVVELFAPGFEVLNPARQEVYLPAKEDGAPVVFDLRPLALGHHRLMLEFFQGSEPLGAADVSVEVVNGPVAADPDRHEGVVVFKEPELAPPDMVLRAVRRSGPGGDTLTLTLIRDGGAYYRTFEPVPLNKAPRLLAQGLLRHMQNIGGSVGAEEQTAPPAAKLGDLGRRLEKTGQALWCDLIPKGLKRIYAEERNDWKDGSLLILSDEPYIPWELLWPYGAGWKDSEPWCLSLRLSRWLRQDETKKKGNGGAPGRLSLDSFAWIAPQDSRLPGAHRERLRLTEMLSRYGVVDVTPNRCTWGAVLDLLEGGGYTWLHAAAHGGFDSSDVGREALLRLEDDQALTTADVVGPSIEEHIEGVRPAFVLNACHAGRLGWGLTELAGWANHLVSLGAGMVLGPFWAVRDDTAMALAETFYEVLLSGETVAEALRRARRAARREHDPSWLAYSLHAHPNARLAIAPRRPEAESRRVPAT